jgi:hypothetical protein
MKAKLIDEHIKYDGTQLASHYAYRNFGLPGNSIIAFTGPVEVGLTEMVDIEDVLLKDRISSDEMLSFIIEIFNMELAGTICLQRLFMAMICEELNGCLKKPLVMRDGDDLYFDKRKLSVSIATASPVSTLIHSALNIKPTGAPVEVSCLEELGIEGKVFAARVMEKFCREFEGMDFARVKVDWVR